MIDIDHIAGNIISDDERGVCIKPAVDAMFSALVDSGLEVDAAYVQQHKALKAARARHSSLHHGLADLVEAGRLLDAAVSALLDRAADFGKRVDAVRSMADIDMDGSPLHGWRDALSSRLNGSGGSTVAGWVPAYKRLRDGLPVHGSEGASN